MFNLIRKLFPTRVASLAEFVQLIKEEDANGVVVQATEKHTIYVGVSGRPRIRLASFRHTLKYAATLADGGTVSFTEAMLNSHGFEEDAADALIKFAVDVQNAADELRQRLPQVEVMLIGPDMSDLRPEFRPA